MNKELLKWISISSALALGAYAILMTMHVFGLSVPAFKQALLLIFNLCNLIITYVTFRLSMINKGFLRLAFLFILIATVSRLFFSYKFHYREMDILQVLTVLVNILGFIFFLCSCVQRSAKGETLFSLLPIIVIILSALIFIVFSESNHFFGINTLSEISFTYGMLLLMISIIILLSCARYSQLILFCLGNLLVFGCLISLKTDFWKTAPALHLFFSAPLLFGKFAATIALCNFFKKQKKDKDIDLFYSLNSIRLQMALWSNGAIALLFFFSSEFYTTSYTINDFLKSITLIYFFIAPFSLSMILISEYLTNPLQKLLQWIDKLHTSPPKKLKLGKMYMLEFNLLKKHMETAFSKIHRQAQQEKKLFDIAAKTVHDIHSPLLVLSMLEEQVRTHLDENEHTLFHNALHRIQHINKELLSQYRSVQRGEEIQKKKSQPEQIAVLLSHILHEKTVQYSQVNFTVEIEEAMWLTRVSLVAHDFSRIISNIIDNAVEASNSKGDIICRLQQDKKPAYCQLSIEDHGVGMSQDNIKKALQGILKTTKKTGHGIGLSAAIEKIKQWKGSCQIESTLNKGTTITLILPTL